VPNFGWTLLTPGGSSRSRLIEKKMRGWLISITSSTLVMPAAAPAETSPAAQFWLITESANATGAFRNFWLSASGTLGTPGSASASERKCVTGMMPVRIAATTMYRIVQMTSEEMMPIGRSRCGFLASSAVVETASKPM
jgi:hypothetical protein